MIYSQNSEDRDHWVVYPQSMSEEDVKADFLTFTGRKPDVIHSPEDSGTKFWFLGYISRAESYKNKQK